MTSSSSSVPINSQAALARVLTLQSTEPQECSQEHPSATELQTYVETQLAGLPYQTQYPAMAMHLDACVTCADAYARLYELTLAEQQNSLPVPAQIPDANLAFLEPAAQTSLRERIRTAIELASQRLTLQLSPDLLPGMQPALAIGTLRAPSDEARYHEQILDLSDETLPVALAAYRDTQQPDRCLLEITVAPPDRDWPDLADIVVTVKLLDETRTVTTDAWGLATVTDMPIDQLADMQIAAEL